MVDLLSIARAEANGEKLERIFSSMFNVSEIKPRGYPNAIVWEGGNFKTLMLTQLLTH